MTASIVSRPLRALVATFTLVALLFGALAPRTASADGAASTRNIILGAAALAAGVIIYNNVQHKRAARNAVVGYTRDGGVVYGDGRIVYPNGRTLYASNGDGRSCGYEDGQERCGARPVAYYPQYNSDRDDRRWRDEGRDRGWSHHHRHDDDRDQGSYDRGHDDQ